MRWSYPNMTGFVDFFGHNLYHVWPSAMEKETSKKDDLYETAKFLHVSLERRLTMLLAKSFLSEDEEVEMRVLKKRKLRCKDIMEGLKRSDG